MRLDDNLSIDEMKRICYEIVDEEIKNEGIKLNVFPLTFVEVSSFYIPYRKYNLIKSIEYALMPLTSYGYNNLNGDVLIFLNSRDIFCSVEHKIFEIVELCYHEIRHSIQEKFDVYSYEGFSRSIDKYFLDSINYLFEYNKYSFEIGADLYGVRKTKEYLKKNYPVYYQKNYKRIKKLENKNTYNYMMYDINDSIDRIVYALRNKEKIRNNKIIDKVNELSNSKFFKDESISNISPILEIFMNEDASFKSISEIIGNDRFKNLDKRIVWAFLSSKSFLEELEFNTKNLSEEELILVSEALQYTNTIYSNKNKYLEDALDKKEIDWLDFFKGQKDLMNKTAFLTRYLQDVNNKLGYIREYDKTGKKGK